MKKLIKTTFLLILFYSCSNEYVDDNIPLEQKFYKIVSFTSTQGLIDINNDGVINSNILLETTNYSSYPYDLQIMIKRSKDYVSFYLPFQNIVYDFNCCPSGYVEFTRNGSILELEKENHLIENLIIDDENEIKYFGKISETRYKLILIKTYYNFNISQNINSEFEIIYEMNNQ